MQKILDAIQRNFFTTGAFIFASGILLYFSLPFDPVVKIPILISVLALACFIVLRRYIWSLIFLFIFGFFYANAFTINLNTPILNHVIRNSEISGVITNVDFASDKTRIFIKTNDGTFRLTLTDGIRTVPSVGANITAKATVFPPSAPDAPGAFDFARWGYFHGISGTGYATEINIETQNINNSTRTKIHDHVSNFGNKTATMLVDSLVLGYSNALPDTDNNAFRGAGVNHIFSISGFHMTLLGGWLILIFYFIFRSIPWITRRIPAKYPAIIFTTLGLFLYLNISGSAVATMRAFLMAGLVAAAFLSGRNLLSLRGISMVFAGLLIINPHFLLDAGFQLSFAAVFGLVWFFGDIKSTKPNGFFWRAWRIFRGVILTSIIAGLFTAPLIAYNFHNIQIYGVIGNLVLLPIFSVLILPLAFISVIGAFFGLSTPLEWMSSMYNLSLEIANKIASLPFAQISVPFISGAAICLIILGFLCLILFGNGFKKLNTGLFSVFVATGIFLIITRPRPIFYASNDHELVAFIKDDGTLQFSKTKSSAHFFTFNTWRIMNSEEPDITVHRMGHGFTGKNYSLKCDHGLCIYQTPKWSLAYTVKFTQLVKNFDSMCNNNFIVSIFEINAPSCAAKIPQRGFTILENGKINFVPYRIWHSLH